jgi:hypothetical protein
MLLLTCSDSQTAGAGQVSIRLVPSGNKPDEFTFQVTGLGKDAIAKLANTERTKDEWTRLFSVYVEGVSAEGKQSQPPLLGSYDMHKNALVFTPRFSLKPGLRYRAVFDPSVLRVPGGKHDPIATSFGIPKRRLTSPAFVSHVYPSVDLLPENQLKFYIHFSAPMRRGESYRHIHLLESSGKEVDVPFLELDEELWDADCERFTLFFDPGRIKRGLKPREEVGPSLEEGKSYTLRIDATWSDAEGNALKEAFSKKFRVGPPDDRPPDPKSWKIETPPAETQRPLVVGFPKAMDHALLGRMIWVVDSMQAKVAGEISIANDEKQWKFTPTSPWIAGRHNLVVDAALEDLAGNSIGRPFEVDVFHPIQAATKAKTVAIPFEIRMAIK